MLALFSDRLRLEGVQWSGTFSESGAWVPERGVRAFFRLWAARKIFFGGHGGDEYGNCTLYFTCPLFSVIWWYSTGHYQTEIEVPDDLSAPEQYVLWVNHFQGITEKTATESQQQ